MCLSYVPFTLVVRLINCWHFIQIWYDNKMLSSQWDINQHFVYIIASWYLLGIITRQGFLCSCSCMKRCACTNIHPLWLEWYKYDSSLQRFDLVMFEGLVFISHGIFSEVNVIFARSLHVLYSRHVDPTELLHLAYSDPQYGRSEALMAAMNTPKTFLM